MVIVVNITITIIK